MQNFLLDTQKFKYSNWFSLVPGEGEEGSSGSLLRAGLFRGSTLSPERKGIWRTQAGSGSAGTPERHRPAAASTLPPAALGSARRDGNMKTAWGLAPQRALQPAKAQCVGDSLASRNGPMLQRYCQNKATALCSHQIGKDVESGPEGSQRPCPLPYR